MKRYLVFIGQVYYPGGGMEDFLTDCDSIEECEEAIETEMLKGFSEQSIYNKEEYLKSEWELTWAHVYDTQDKTIIWSKINY